MRALSVAVLLIVGCGGAPCPDTSIAGTWKTCDSRCPANYQIQNQSCSDPGLVCVESPNYWKALFCTIATCVCDGAQCTFHLEPGLKGGAGVCDPLDGDGGVPDLAVPDLSEPADLLQPVDGGAND